jgi:hypothetical protein
VVNVPRLLASLRRVLWLNGHVFPEDVRETKDAEGNVTITILIPAQYIEPAKERKPR